jgi:hypothetical protein
MNTNTYTYVRNLRTGRTTQVFGWKAGVVGTILALLAPFILFIGMAVLLLAFLSPVLILAGLINMCIVGLNVWNILLVVVGVVLIFNLKITRSY